MNTWQNVTINDLGQVITGSTPPTKKTEYYGNEYPFITPTDIEIDSRIVHTERFLSQEGYEYNKKRLLPRNAVCVVCIASIGKICMTSVPSVTNQQINSVVVDQQKHNPYFVYYLLRTMSNILHNFAGGVATPIVNKSTFSNLEVCIPPLPTQRKIAVILSTYDDLIENNTRRIKILEDIAQTLYQEWFVHYRFPGHENVSLVESELGPIPQGWEAGKFESIVENVKEKVKPGKHLNPLPYVPIDCIPRRSISLMESKSSSEAKSSLITFKRNDILFGAMRSYFHKVSLAPFNGITRQTCFVLRSKNSNNYPFDLFTTFQDSTVEYSSNHSTGSTIPYATWDLGLAIMPIVIPPSSLIKQFSDIVIPLLDSIVVIQEKNANLRQTRDLLLPKLISGEIDVSELDIDTNEIQPKKGGTYIPYPLTERLHSDKKILGGKPVIRGTRLAVELIFDLLEQGWSEENILENYPRITHEDIKACQEYQKR